MQNDPKTTITRLVLFVQCLVISTITSFSAAGQTEEFIIAVIQSKIKMSNSSIDYERKVKANDLVLKLDYVKMGSLAKAQKKGKLSFSIPGRSKRITATATHVEYLSDTN